MASKDSPSLPEDLAERRRPRNSEHSPINLGALGIVVGAIAAYRNSFSAPFVFQDLPDIVDNPTIRHLGDLSLVLSPPSANGLTVGGRPVVNLTLAINYALGGTRVWGYHAFNLLIHVLAGLTLFGIVRRTLVLVARNSGGRRSTGAGDAGSAGDAGLLSSRPPSPRLRRAGAAGLGFDGWASPVGFAFAAALIWTLHPLQTESVTYVVQRAESLMGLFYLLTLYCFIRYVERREGRAGPLGPSRPTGGPSGPALPRSELSKIKWAGLSIFFCLLGMATKEVMVSAPLIVFFYDRTFVSLSFREVRRRHKGVYLGLGCTWILLGALAIGTGERGGTAGFGIGVSWWNYVLTQFPAVLHYLRLALWPHPLIFDYGAEWVTNGWEVLPAAVVVTALAAGSAYLLFRGSDGLIEPPLPGSAHEDQAVRSAGENALADSRVTSQNRLPETPVRGLCWLGFLGVWFFAILAPTSLVPGASQTMAEHRMYLALAPVVVLGLYGMGLVWDSIAGRCDAGRAGREDTGVDPAKIRRKRAITPFFYILLLGLSLGLTTAHRNGDYRTNLALWDDTAVKRPGHARAYANLGNALFDAGRLPEAIAQYRNGLRADPASPEAHNGLGNAWLNLGRLREAAGQFEEAVEARPGYPEAHNNLGSVLIRLGENARAMDHFQTALRLRPDYADAHYNLGLAYAFAGQMPQAISQFEQALRLVPDKADVRNNLAAALAGTGRFSEAIAEYRQVLRSNPNYAEAHNNLANALAEIGRLPEAIPEYEAALRLKPDYSKAHSNLGLALANTGRLPEAVEHYRVALRLEPNFADAHYNLALALRALGQNREAQIEFEAAERLQGNRSGNPP